MRHQQHDPIADADAAPHLEDARRHDGAVQQLTPRQQTTRRAQRARPRHVRRKGGVRRMDEGDLLAVAGEDVAVAHVEGGGGGAAAEPVEVRGARVVERDVPRRPAAAQLARLAGGRVPPTPHAPPLLRSSSTTTTATATATALLRGIVVVAPREPRPLPRVVPVQLLARNLAVRRARVAPELLRRLRDRCGRGEAVREGRRRLHLRRRRLHRRLVLRRLPRRLLLRHRRCVQREGGRAAHRCWAMCWAGSGGARRGGDHRRARGGEGGGVGGEVVVVFRHQKSGAVRASHLRRITPEMDMEHAGGRACTRRRRHQRLCAPIHHARVCV